MASGGGLTDLVTVFKYRKIKLIEGNNFTVSSALVIKLKILDLCLTVKNQWGLITGDDGVCFMWFISVILHSPTF